MYRTCLTLCLATKLTDVVHFGLVEVPQRRAIIRLNQKSSLRAKRKNARKISFRELEKAVKFCFVTRKAAFEVERDRLAAKN